MEYKVKYLREQGLTVKWGKTRAGQPAIFGLSERRVDKQVWVIIDNKMWERAKIVGIREAFREFTTFIDFFSVAV